MKKLLNSSVVSRLGEIQNVRVTRTKRKDLARMLTVLGEQLVKETK